MSTETLEAGPELDARVAEEIMGWIVNRSDGRHWHTLPGRDGRNPHRLIGRDCCASKYDGGDFCPSTDIAAAWEVVEALRKRGGGYAWRIESWEVEWEATVYTCDLQHNICGEATAPTAPLAICRAALAAVQQPTEAP